SRYAFILQASSKQTTLEVFYTLADQKTSATGNPSAFVTFGGRSMVCTPGNSNRLGLGDRVGSGQG
ncbi:MAG: hypothetical protein M1305_04655, partial [Candidatus Marsarchaeota archaeon]|nr:hypothetical protein [Candidatus Marsarchaeota archaeon]